MLPGASTRSPGALSSDEDTGVEACSSQVLFLSFVAMLRARYQGERAVAKNRHSRDIGRLVAVRTDRTATMSYSPAVNLLLYSSNLSHPLHAETRGSPYSCMNPHHLHYRIRPTLGSDSMIANRSSVFDELLTPEEAVANAKTRATLSHTCCLAEEHGFPECRRAMTGGRPFVTIRLPDVHPVALLRVHGARGLFTRDRDFRKFEAPDMRDRLLDGVPMPESVPTKERQSPEARCETA